jgi:hypothetical protein
VGTDQTFEWVDDVAKTLGVPVAQFLKLSHKGCSEQQLAAAERALGTALPATYRRFLARWNGSTEADREEFFFSIETLVQWGTENAPFAPAGSGLEPEITDDYYKEKPYAFLAVYRTPLGDDVQCLDLREPSADPPVVLFDAEEELARPANPAVSEFGYYPNFGSLLLDHVLFSLEEGPYKAELRAAAWKRCEEAAKKHGLSPGNYEF